MSILDLEKDIQELVEYRARLEQENKRQIIELIKKEIRLENIKEVEEIEKKVNLFKKFLLYLSKFFYFIKIRKKVKEKYKKLTTVEEEFLKILSQLLHDFKYQNHVEVYEHIRPTHMTAYSSSYLKEYVRLQDDYSIEYTYSVFVKDKSSSSTEVRHRNRTIEVDECKRLIINRAKELYKEQEEKRIKTERYEKQKENNKNKLGGLYEINTLEDVKKYFNVEVTLDDLK